MRRIKVEVAFTIDVKSDEPGIPKALESVSWIDAVTFGLTKADWEIVNNVHCNATRRLTDLGDPTTPNGMKKRLRRYRSQAEVDAAYSPKASQRQGRAE